MKKRWIALILAMLTVLPTLAACGGKNLEETTAATTAATTAE